MTTAQRPISLSHADRTRLAKLLGLLGSHHQGERDNAGIAAHRLVKERGTTWPDVLRPPVNDRQPERKAPWRVTCADLLKRPYSLRPWERVFLQSLSGFPRLSPKQARILDEIASRVLRKETAA